jgi:tRNA wybutosine-synthesizing protein 1
MKGSWKFLVPTLVFVSIGLTVAVNNHLNTRQKPIKETAEECQEENCCQSTEKEISNDEEGCYRSSGIASNAEESCCRSNGNASNAKEDCCRSNDKDASKAPETTFKILYGSQSGRAQTLAHKFASRLPYETSVLSIKDYENENLFSEQSIIIFFLSTYTGGLPTETAVWFNDWLQELRFDVRVGKKDLESLRFGVFGLGDSAYKQNFCTFAIKVDEYLHDLGAKRVSTVELGDHADDYSVFDKFVKQVLDSQQTNYDVFDENDPVEDQELDLESIYSSENDSEETQMVDIEDLGKSMVSEAKKELKEMVTPKLRASLEKQRYKIIGSHSGVKVCRWTKSMLRGRGGCYKHSFYGIESHRCMETTPSLGDHSLT